MFAQSRLCLAIATLCFAGLFATTTQAALLSVNLGNTSSTTETGFSDWQIPDNQAGPHTTTINSIDLTATRLGGSSNIRAINRSFRASYNTPDPRPLPQLSRSWWGVQGSVSVGQAEFLLQIDGSDLGAGLFDWTSWHVDHDDQTGDMLVELSVDGGVNYSTVAASFDIVDGRDEDLFVGAPNPLTFSFLSNGTDDIIVRYSNLETAQSRNFLVINGFEIVSNIPEPASASLLALAGLALLRRRRQA